MSIRVVEDGASLQDVLSRFPDDICIPRSRASAEQLAVADQETVTPDAQRWARRLLLVEGIIFAGIIAHIHQVFTTDEQGNKLPTAAQIKEAKGDRVFHVFEAEIANLRMDYYKLTDELMKIGFSDDVLDRQIQEYNNRVDCILHTIQEYRATIKNGGPKNHTPLICPRKIPYTPAAPPKPMREAYDQDLLTTSALPCTLETA